MPTAEVPDERRATARTVGRVAAIGALAVLATIGHIWYGNRNHLYDLRIYAAAMRWWDDGHPLYDFSVADFTQGHLGYTYPPFAAVVMRPLAWFSAGPVAAIYLVATATALIAIAYWLTAGLADRLGQPRWFVAGLAVPLLSAIEPIRATVDFGQINLLLMALVLVDLLVLYPRRSRFAGVGIGLAAAIKLIPAIFIGYLLVTRRWRAATVAVGTAVGATLLAAAVSPADSWRFWTETLRHAAGVGDLAYFSNQSVLGLLARTGAPPAAVWLAVALPVLGYGMWRAGRVARAGDEITGIALAGLAGGLASPVTWHHHLVWLAPALVSVLTAAIVADPATIRRTVLLVVSAVGYIVLVASPLALYQDVLDHPGGALRPLLVNWYVWLAVALLALLPTTPDLPRVARTAPVPGRLTAETGSARDLTGPPFPAGSTS